MAEDPIAALFMFLGWLLLCFLTAAVASFGWHLFTPKNKL